MPTAKVFRSRGGALWWSFWVIVAAVMTVGFADTDDTGGNSAVNAAAPNDALGQPTDAKEVEQLVKALNG